MKSSGCDRVLTVDVHSAAAQRLFPIPVISISPAEVFAQALHDYGLTEATIVAPDNGAIHRCEDLKAAAGLPKSPTPYFEKHRTDTGIIHVNSTASEAGSPSLTEYSRRSAWRIGWPGRRIAR